MGKHLLLACCLLVGLSWANEGRACLNASQNRLLPLGFHKGKLLLLELDLRRRGSFSVADLGKKGGGMKVIWWGKSYVREMGVKGVLSRKRRFFSKVRFFDRRYKKSLRKLVLNVRKVLRIRWDIRRIRVLSCHFRRRCRGFRLIRKSKRWWIAKRGLARVLRSRPFFSRTNRLASLRLIETNKATFGIFQLSAGPVSCPPRCGGTVRARSCHRVGRCIPRPLVLHHGSSLDVAVSLPKGTR